MFIACLLLSAPITIELAPDQPMPFVYLDEPLLIEVQSETDTSAKTTLDILSSDKTIAWTSPETEITLRANSPYWSIYEELPVQRGFFSATFKLKEGETTQEISAHFTRIDRPYQGAPQTFTIFAEKDFEKTLRLMRHTGVPAARVRLDSPHLEDTLQLARTAGMKLNIYADGDSLDALLAQAEALAQAHCQDIARWEIVTRGEKGRIEKLGAVVKAQKCAMPIYAVLRKESELKQLMEDGGHAQVQGLIAEGADLGYGALLLWQEAIHAGGYETFPMESINTIDAPAEDGHTDTSLIFNTFMQRVGGAQNIGLDGRLLYHNGPGELLAYFNGLAPQMTGFTPFGVMPLSANVTAPILRNGKKWCMVLWNSAGREALQLPLGAAENLSLTDAFNNTQPALQLSGGVVNFEVAQKILFLWGEDGDLIPRASKAQAGYLARRFLDIEKADDYFPAGLMELVQQISQDPGGLESRTQFLQLIRSFPEIEAQWHSGLLPRPLAVSAIATLAGLARHLCVLEEARGEPILEPTNDMLARARDLESLYLSANVSADQPLRRGEGLLQEVKRLGDEAHALSEAGVRIEAAALAALCEWRARALEFAAKAGPQSTLDTVAAPVPAVAAKPVAASKPVAEAKPAPKAVEKAKSSQKAPPPAKKKK